MQRTIIMRIVILGGSFDPPHNGHLILAREVVKQLSIEQVWLIPCFAHAFEKKLTRAEHRLAMIKLLETENIKVSDYEIQKGGISYSIETITELAKAFPNHSFSWVIGSDQVKDFPKWEGWREIISTFGLVIVARGKEENIENKTKEVLRTLSNIRFLYATNIPDISSTVIREKIKNNESISNLVPKSVKEYIIKHQLYEY